MIFVGIDPGKDGVVAVDWGGGKIIVNICPTIKAKKTKRDYLPSEMAKLIPNNADFVVLEKSQPMPGQGVTSMFSIGQGFGLWEGILAAKGIKYIIVHPKTWQKEILRDVPGDNTKARAIIQAKRLFTDVPLKSERARKDNPNIADALMMMEYGKREAGNFSV